MTIGWTWRLHAATQTAPLARAFKSLASDRNLTGVKIPLFPHEWRESIPSNRIL
jgi:hypothetical protein